MDLGSRKQACIRWGLDHPKGQLLGEKTCQGMPNDTLPLGVQKWLNRLIFSLGCGLGLAEGSTISIVFATWRQCARHCPDGRAHWLNLANTIEPSACGGDAALCQITLSTCY